MTLDELLSMSIGDKIINRENIWVLESIDRQYEPDITQFNFVMKVDTDYTFIIQVAYSWKDPVHFIYNYENPEYYMMLDPALKDTILYSKQEHIKLYRKKINDHYKDIFYYTNKIIELESE